MSKFRIEGKAGFILHRRPYRESSYILEAFTREYGRISLVAKGVRRPKSKLRGLLEPFSPLLLSWSGKSELHTLVDASYLPGSQLPQGDRLLCGFYLNELLVRLLAKHDPHSELFDLYEATVMDLVSKPIEPTLRRFELALLRDIGYELRLTIEGDTQQPVAAEAYYSYLPETGLVRTNAPNNPEEAQYLFKGVHLLAIADQKLDNDLVLRQAKRLIRKALAEHLGERKLAARELLMG